MATFSEANQARLSLKMKLSNYSWYHSSGVFLGNGDYYVVITVSKINDQIRKLIPQVIENVSITTEIK